MTDHLPADGKMVDLDRLQALHEAATPGPWARRGDVSIKADPNGFSDVLIPGPVRCGRYCLGGSSDIEVESSDLDLIVAMRNALPALLAEVRALRAERERTEAALREIASLGESIVKCREYLQSTDHHDNYMDRNRCRTEEAKAVDRLILASIAYWREPKETNNAT